MTKKLTSLLAAAVLAGTCSYALAQGAGAGAGGGGAGSDISTPKLNSGPGGTAKPTAGMKTRMVHYKRKHHRHHRRHHRM